MGIVAAPDAQPEDRKAGKVRRVKTAFLRKVLSSFCPGEEAVIVMISESLLHQSVATDGRISRDCVLTGHRHRHFQAPD
jgi:hypothetical protein